MAWNKKRRPENANAVKQTVIYSELPMKYAKLPGSFVCFG
jgi:hypothetical protein